MVVAIERIDTEPTQFPVTVKPRHAKTDARPTTAAELVQLHAVMGHYARMLHDFQKQRIATANRVGAMKRDNLPDVWIEPAEIATETMKSIERAIDRNLAKFAGRHPISEWINSQRGIGLGGFARLLAVTGPLDRFNTVSKLWKYLGYAVVDGRAQRMKHGEIASHTNCSGGTHLRTCPADCKRDHHPNCTPDGFGTAYSPQGKMLCRQIAEAIVKVGGAGKYRLEYDRKKAFYQAERPTWTKQHCHEAAMRYSVKCLLRDLWEEWHTNMPTYES